MFKILKRSNLIKYSNQYLSPSSPLPFSVQLFWVLFGRKKYPALLPLDIAVVL